MKQLDPKAVWLFFISSVFKWISFFALLSIWLPLYMGELPENAIDGNYLQLFLRIMGLLLVVFIVSSYVIARLTYHFYRYEMTDIVFKKEHGIIWKKYVSIPYDRIQNVDIYRGVWARLLGLSDIQIQTAGGITAGSYGAFSEGRLMGVSKEEAEKLRDELIQKARHSRSDQRF